MSGERMVLAGRDMKLCCRVDGDPAQPAIVLIAGLAQQLNVWPERFVAALVEHGHRVVRFDNRDVGRSSRAAAPAPTPLQIARRRFNPAQYTLADMAQDTVGLLNSLEIDAAHLVGMSMGGMIGQTVAARNPDRVLTLTSIMSSTGGRKVGRPAPSTYRRMLARPATKREVAAERTVAMMRHIGSHGFPYDDAFVRAVALEAWDRAGGANPAGPARQVAAIIKSGDRTAEVRRIAAPTLVIHGDRDRMVHPSGGRATAEAIPGARLLTIPGMGHDLPEGAWPRLAEAITEHTRRRELATR